MCVCVCVCVCSYGAWVRGMCGCDVVLKCKIGDQDTKFFDAEHSVSTDNFSALNSTCARMLQGKTQIDQVIFVRTIS